MLKILKSYIKLSIIKNRVSKLEKTIKKINKIKQPKSMQDFYVFNYKLNSYRNRIERLNKKLKNIYK